MGRKVINLITGFTRDMSSIYRNISEELKEAFTSKTAARNDYFQTVLAL